MVFWGRGDKTDIADGKRDGLGGKELDSLAGSEAEVRPYRRSLEAAKEAELPPYYSEGCCEDICELSLAG